MVVAALLRFTQVVKDRIRAGGGGARSEGEPIRILHKEVNLTFAHNQVRASSISEGEQITSQSPR
jgi:hypothetical protein